MVAPHSTASAPVVEKVDTDATLRVTLKHADLPYLTEFVDTYIVVECDASANISRTSPLRMLPSLLCYDRP